MTEDILEKAKDALDHAISESSGGVYLDPSCNDLLPICRELIAEVERLRSENEALNEKLVEERAALIIRYAPEDCPFRRECYPAWCVHDEPRKCPHIDHFLAEAIQQLKAEMPGMEWE